MRLTVVVAMRRAFERRGDINTQTFILFGVQCKHEPSTTKTITIDFVRRSLESITQCVAVIFRKHLVSTCEYNSISRVLNVGNFSTETVIGRPDDQSQCFRSISTEIDRYPPFGTPRGFSIATGGAQERRVFTNAGRKGEGSARTGTVWFPVLPGKRTRARGRHVDDR